MLNVGCLFDIQTGRYYRGKHGESILNGGFPHFEGIVGLPNMFKTAISLYKLGAAMSRYSQSMLQAHDSENTLSIGRIETAFNAFPELAELDLHDPESARFAFSDASVYQGNEWFDALKESSKARRGNKEILLTTPFYNHKSGQFLKIPVPLLSFLDSLSHLSTDSVNAMYDKNEIGESGLNMVNMKGSNVKSQMIEQITNVTSSGGIYSIMTGHVGEQYQLDMYKPAVKRLKFLKGDLKLKKIPENFSFLTSNCWYCASVSILLSSDKEVEFPRNKEDDMKGDTDLIAVSVINLRGKHGPSGIPFDIVISQSEGVKVGLTEFLYIKQGGRYGIGGNVQNFHIALYPDVNLTRRTIRQKIEDDKKLQRALTITSEMLQMRMMWHHLEDELVCTPEQLYKELKEKGYDWDLLLNTRGYWTFQEDKNPMPFLSTMDLLRMRVGKYHPYWYPKTLEEMNLPPLIKDEE